MTEDEECVWDVSDKVLDIVEDICKEERKDVMDSENMLGYVRETVL